MNRVKIRLLPPHLVFLGLCFTTFFFAYAQIQIDSLETLQSIGSNPSYPRNGNYVLTRDIDASPTRDWNNGKGFTPIGNSTEPFVGSFDGQGYKITGLYINRRDEQEVGLFGCVATEMLDAGTAVGRVRNLSIIDAEIIGGDNVGVVAGKVYKKSANITDRHLIENIKVFSSQVIGSTTVGGIAGSISEGTIRNCFVKDIFIKGTSFLGGISGTSSAKIERCCATGLIYGEGSKIGGLSGSASPALYSSITQCFSTCWVFGMDSVGGLIGDNYALTTECYSAGLVYGRSNVGGLVGTGDSSKVQVSFFDIDASQQTQSAGGGQLYTTQMLMPDIFESVGWDYTNVWEQVSGKTRPYLKIFPTTTEVLSLTLITAGGSVETQPSGPYNLWSVVELTPQPATGFRFGGYEIYSGTSKAFIVPVTTPIAWTMTSNISLQVKFIPDQPISIDNIQDLQKIGNDLGYPLFWSYVITADIDANDTSTWNDGQGFAPIGTNVFWFEGLIQGSNFIISNLYMNRPQEQNVGLIRYIAPTARVENLSISNSTVTGGNNVGLLASENSGNVKNVVISNSVVQGDTLVGGLASLNKGIIEKNSVVDNTQIICATEYAGAICAKNESGAKIFFSHTDANTSGASYVGGITGQNRGNIHKSWSKGSVHSSDSYVGGIAGTNQGSIYQSYSHANIECASYGGGLVGHNFSVIEECYSTGNVTEEKPNSGGLIGENWGTVQRAFWDTQTSGYTTSAGGVGKTTAEMINRATFEAEGWNFEQIWDNDGNTQYPYLIETTFVPDLINLPLEEARTLLLSSSLSVGEINYQCSDIVALGNVITSSPLPGIEVRIGYAVNLLVSEGPCPAQIKTISTIEELQLIGNSVDYPLDAEYELSQDIDASQTSNWNNGQGFVPIGNVLNPFTGYFDGKGHKITNLKINRPYTDHIGLFGKIADNATVQNLILENVNISGMNNTGGVIGMNENGNVYNVGVSGVISGKGNLGGIVGLHLLGTLSDCVAEVTLVNSRYNSNTGGIVGQNQEYVTRCVAVVNVTITNTPFGAGGIVGSNGGFITYCISMGSIAGSDNCGGVVGTNAQTVSKCWSNVYLDGQNNIGGLVGKNTSGTVNNCFATGRVKASFYSGGLIGALFGGTVDQCYSIGKVTGISGYIGGLIGYSFGGETSNSFWNISTSGLETSFGGVGKNTSELLNVNTYLSAGWDFTNVWYFPGKNTRSYPQLRSVTPIEFKNVPTLIGLSQESAIGILTETGLTTGSITRQCYTGVPAGNVYDQKPYENDLVAEGYPVDLWVSTGPCSTTVPLLIGLTLPEAESALSNRNLSIGNISYECSNQYSEGVVIQQHPIQGTQVLEGTIVDVTVSLGPCITVVPSVIGLSQNDAVSSLTSSGLGNNIIYDCNNIFTPGLVFDQQPVGGTQVAVGSIVVIYVSTGPCEEGVTEGSGEGEGIIEGEGMVEGDGLIEGEGIVEGVQEGEGTIEGEGLVEGYMEGQQEGVLEEGEGIVEEGEGQIEEGEITVHSADTNNDGKVNLSELLRVIQFFNMGGYHCQMGTEDGYAPGYDGDHTCRHHSSDYNPADWKISLGELLRLIQIFNIGYYLPCPGQSEDGFCF